MAGRPFQRFVLGAGLAVGLVGVVSCTVDFGEGVPPPDDTFAPGVDLRPSEDMVAIRFRNLTADEAVNVEFYATNDSLEDLPDDLFVDDNLLTTSIGVAGTGIIQPWQVDAIEFPCTANLTIGTHGGRFVDSESGEPRGIGTPRWAQEGPLGLCGAVVTLEFAGDGVEFTTVLSIGD